MRFLDGRFLNGFDVLKLYLHRLPVKAAKVSGEDVEKFVYRGIMLEGKNYILQFKTSKGE